MSTRVSARAYGKQSLGARKQQEDQFAACGHGGGGPYLVVIADGMGGHQGGEIASDVAVEAFIAGYERWVGTDAPARLRAALSAASDALAEKVRERPELEGMGTTLLAVANTPDGLFRISVGDSLLWQVDGSGLRRLNEDHSMRSALEAMVQSGEITAEAAARSPHRNQLRSVLGEEEPELIDCPDEPMALGTSPTLILATDGIETLDEAEIAAIVGSAGSTARAIVDRLLAAVEAKAKPRQDNTTVYFWKPVIVDTARTAAAAPPASAVRARPRRSKAMQFAGAAVLLLGTGALTGLGYRALQSGKGLEIKAPAPKPAPLGPAPGTVASTPAPAPASSPVIPVATPVAPVPTPMASPVAPRPTPKPTHTPKPTPTPTPASTPTPAPASTPTPEPIPNAPNARPVGTGAPANEQRKALEDGGAAPSAGTADRHDNSRTGRRRRQGD